MKPSESSGADGTGEWSEENEVALSNEEAAVRTDAATQKA